MTPSPTFPLLVVLTFALFGTTSWMAIDGAAAIAEYPTPVELIIISAARLAWIPPALWTISVWTRRRLRRAYEEGASRERAEADDRLRASAAHDATELAGRLDALSEASDALTMHLQPIVDLRTGCIAGYEALARFATEPRHPPDWWFAEAHLLGQGVDLECSAIRRALSHLGSLPDGVYLSLNLSPTTLRSDWLRQILHHHDATRVVLELTEHDIVEDYDDLRRNVGTLVAAGTRLAVDDVGAGFASLRHILNLAPAIVKLDRSLVAGIDGDPYRRALASSLLRFAVEAGVEVVAEGVERDEELDTLVSLGVPLAQGYLLGRPAAASQALNEVRTGAHHGTMGAGSVLDLGSGRRGTIDLLREHAAGR